MRYDGSRNENWLYPETQIIAAVTISKLTQFTISVSPTESDDLLDIYGRYWLYYVMTKTIVIFKFWRLHTQHVQHLWTIVDLNVFNNTIKPVLEAIQ